MIIDWNSTVEKNIICEPWPMWAWSTVGEPTPVPPVPPPVPPPLPAITENIPVRQYKIFDRGY